MKNEHMTKEEFRLLFERALEIAAENAEKQAGRPVPRSFEIEMHGVGPHPKIMEKNEAFEAVYLGPDRFYRITEVSVIRVSKDVSTVFMCISGHIPGPLNETWNQPPGSGPFKQLLATRLAVVE
jgi:hypothetical protein